MEINVTPSDSGAVIEANDQDFEAKVINRSQEMPVLVDFWAPWCGPCKTLGPVLEKVAGQMDGRFELVKVNVDESPMLAQALRIQSIPAVKLFINGQIQDEFMGAYPEPEVVRFLEHHLPSEQVDDAMLGLRAWQMGDSASAQRIFQQVLQQDPKNAAALIGQGHCRMDEGDLEGARQAVAAVNEVELDKLTERQQLERLLSVLRSRVFLNEQIQIAPDDGNPMTEQLRTACEAALTGQFQAALEPLFDIVKKDRKFRDDAGRKAMLAVFDLMPPQDPQLAAYRQKLSNLLFS